MILKFVVEASERQEVLSCESGLMAPCAYRVAPCAYREFPSSKKMLTIFMGIG
jgi:hypothetical protein